jgi:tetratricopeptide (TPR) repeat protein
MDRIGQVPEAIHVLLTSGRGSVTSAINRPLIDACTALINSQGGNDENRALIHLQRGSMYRRLGKFELALVDFSESIRHDPNSALAYTGLGNAYRGLELFDLAIAALTEALRLRPEARTYNNRGNVYQDLKDNERAIADYDTAIKLDPNYATAYYNRGNARLEGVTKMAPLPTIGRPPSSILISSRPPRRCGSYSTGSFWRSRLA